MVALAPESILLLQSTACQPLVPAGKGCRLHEGSKRSVRANAQKGARKNGYFSDADPNAPLRSPLDRFRAGADFTKRGGRYKSDFIWNTNWQEQLAFEEAEEERRKAAAAKPAEQPSGFLSFGRLERLADIGEDLSEALRPRPRADSSEQVHAIEDPPKGPVFDKIKATHGEQRRWQRQDKFNRVAAPRTAAPPAVVQSMSAVNRATSQAAGYDSLKGEIQSWSLALCVMCAGATAYFYDQEVAASYTMGALGGLVYLRMLHKHLDSLGGSGNLVSGVISNQRLLVPVVLVMAFNRWNTLAAEHTGLTLQLLPVLLGFFTYKGALVARQSVLLFEELSGKRPLANKQA